MSHKKLSFFRTHTFVIPALLLFIGLVVSSFTKHSVSRTTTSKHAPTKEELYASTFFGETTMGGRLYGTNIFPGEISPEVKNILKDLKLKDPLFLNALESAISQKDYFELNKILTAGIRNTQDILQLQFAKSPTNTKRKYLPNNGVDVFIPPVIVIQMVGDHEWYSTMSGNDKMGNEKTVVNMSATEVENLIARIFQK